LGTGDSRYTRIIALKMEAASTSETPVNVYHTTRRNNPEHNHFHTRRRKNLKFHQRKTSVKITGLQAEI
jgi:hypothetical protein